MDYVIPTKEKNKVYSEIQVLGSTNDACMQKMNERMRS